MNSIRLATVRDIDSICDVYLSSRQVAYSGVLTDSQLSLESSEIGRADRTRDWLAIFDEDDTRVFVAEEEGHIVGIVATAPFGSHNQRCAELFRLYVLPEFSGQGIGTRLLQVALTDLEAREITTVLISIIDGYKDGQMFWEHRGWKPTNEVNVENWYGEPLSSTHFIGSLTEVLEAVHSLRLPTEPERG